MNRLNLSTCLDSHQRAAQGKRALAIPRASAAALGNEAQAAAETGCYLNTAGQRIDWQAAVAKAVAAKRSLPPDAALPRPGGRS